MALSWIPDLDLYDPPDTFTEKATPMMNCYGRGKRRPNLRTLQFPKKLLEIISLQPGATKKSIKETPKNEAPVKKSRSVGRGRARSLKERAEHARLSRPGDVMSEGVCRSRAGSTISVDSLSSTPDIYSSHRQYSSSGAKYFSHGKRANVFEDDDFPELPGTNNELMKQSNSRQVEAQSKPPSLSQIADDVYPTNQLNDNEMGEELLQEYSYADAVVESWDLKGDHVIQIENLPLDVNISSLTEFVSSFGDVVDCVMKEVGNHKVAQIKMSCEDECEWIIGCLDGSAELSPEYSTKLNCFLVS